MKKNGFTLVELLGVIIILSLLLILALPSIVNSVRSSSKDTDELTLKLIYEAADLYVSNHSSDFPKKDGSQFVISLKDLVDEELLSSPIKLSDSELDITDTKSVQVTYNNGFDYQLKDSDDCKVKYSNGTIVYFDVQSGEVCSESDYHEDNSAIGYNGYNNKGSTKDNTKESLATQNSCLKFYAFNDEGGDTLNLLLDHNTTADVAWSSGSNLNGPSPHLGNGYVLEFLKCDTDSWQGTLELENYTHETIGYTVDYSGYKARLITAQEIAKITGADKALNWNENSTEISDFYFDGAKGTDLKWQTQVANSLIPSEYYWLYDRTKDCVNEGCKVNDTFVYDYFIPSINYGYWTSTGCLSALENAWGVSREGKIKLSPTTFSTTYGVRPVIEISKEKLKIR